MRASEETYQIRERRSRMTSASRLVLAAASLLLLLAYVLPIWKISLDAPQYPEGLGMYIEVDNIRGVHEGNLASINGLNHYIGMKEIHPDSIPELRIMPWLFAALIVLGLAAAASGRRWALYTWVGLFLLLAIVGLTDFYLWEYDYGHNLDHERAIIKVPGMNYQPPLIGSKQMLNITAVSLPAAGGIATMVSLLTGLVLAVREWRIGARAAALAAVLAGVLLVGCGDGPRAIRYGEDVCTNCKMTASDARYGAEFVNANGKAYVFDSIECLSAYLASVNATGGTSYTSTIDDPGKLIHVSQVYFARSEAIMSPMGAHLGAFSSAAARDGFIVDAEGEALSWDDVLALAATDHEHKSMHTGMRSDK